MKYLIDTNICIYILNRRPIQVLDKFETILQTDVFISSITIAEMQYGISKSAKYNLNQQRLNQFLSPIQILPFCKESAVYYGETRTSLERSGKMIGHLDLLIAAQALCHRVTLVTNNEKEFKRIEGLTVQNWCNS